MGEVMTVLLLMFYGEGVEGSKEQSAAAWWWHPSALSVLKGEVMTMMSR